MITKLRRNFILVAMCSMAAVLAVIVGTLNLVSYLNMVTKADYILEMLAEKGETETFSYIKNVFLKKK